MTISNHELACELSCWRSQEKEEVDLVLYGESGLVAVEVKRSARFREDDLAALQEFTADYPVARGYLLYGGSQRLKFDAIEVLPLGDALRNLPELLR